MRHIWHETGFPQVGLVPDKGPLNKYCCAVESISYCIPLWDERRGYDCLFLVSDWGTLIVAKMSPWLQPDSSVEAIRRNSEEVSV